MQTSTTTGGERWSSVRRFFEMLKLDRKDITYIYIYAIFAGVITLSLPLGIQAIIGLIVGGKLSASLYVLIGVVTIGTALTGILKIMQITVTENLQRRIFTRSAFEFAYRIPRLKLEAMLSDYPPELVNRFFDTLNLQKGVPKLLMDFSTAVLQIIFGLVLISFYHPFFVFFSIILVVILLLIMRITGPGGLKTSLKESKYKYKVVYWLEEMARTTTTFKLAGNSSLPLRRTDDLVSNYLDSRKQHFRILITQYGNIVGFKTLVTFALLLLGGTLVIDNQINIGQFVAAEIVVILIMASVEKLILSMETIYDVLTASEKIGSVIDIPLDQESGIDFHTVCNGDGMSVNLEKVTFRFADAERPTLDKISLNVKPKERLCIAGYSGAGKNTLIQLIAGLYTEFQGAITYNGIPMKNLNINTLRNVIGNHSQESDIFKGTIMDNICLGHEELTLTDVIAAAKKVGLQRYIQKLPEGYNTELLPGGRNVPKSIRTKIILARSFAARPNLLAFEEFLNKLEADDQERIADFLTDPSNPWTLITVSNNPLIASRCDRTIIMRAGEIIAEGTFEEIRENPHFDQIFLNNSKAVKKGLLKSNGAGSKHKAATKNGKLEEESYED